MAESTRVSSSSWFNKTVSRQSMDDSDSMLESIRDRRNRRKAGGDSGQITDENTVSEVDSVSNFPNVDSPRQNGSSPHHIESSPYRISSPINNIPHELPTLQDIEKAEDDDVFKIETSPAKNEPIAALRSAPPVAKRRNLNFAKSPIDVTTSSMKPDVAVLASNRRASVATSGAAPRRLSVVDQQQFRNQLKQRADRAQTKAHHRARRKSRARLGSRFDQLKDEGLTKEADEYLNSLQRNQGGISLMDSYDFFCRVWKRGSGRKSASIREKQKSSSEKNAKEYTVVELLNTNHFESLIFTHTPTMFSNDATREKLATLLFSPAAMPAVELHEKISSSSVPPVDPAEDGFYVAPNSLKGRRKRSMAVLQRRLLTSGGRDWFGSDGSLINVEDMFGEESVRIVLPDSSTSSMIYIEQPRLWPVAIESIHWNKGSIYRPNVRLSDPAAVTASSAQLSAIKPAASAARFQLNIHVLQLRFWKHPLFSREHDLAQTVRELVLQYMEQEECINERRLTQRLWALRRARDAARVASPPHQEETQLRHNERRVRRYCLLVKKLRVRRQELINEQRTRCRQILRHWRELKDLRESQHYSSCRLRLQIQKQLNVPGGAGHQLNISWSREVEAELDELEEEHSHLYQQQLIEYKRKMSEWKQKQSQLSVPDNSQDQLQPPEQLQQQLGPPPAAPSQFDRQKVMQEVKSRVYDNHESPDETKLFFQLVDDHPITDTEQCPKSEQQRRAEIKRLSLLVRVFIGGRQVSSTKLRPLEDQTMKIVYQSVFATRLRRTPPSVQLSVYQNASVGRLSTTYVATSKLIKLAQIDLPTPASHVTEHTTSTKWYDFEAVLDKNLVQDGPNVRGQLQTALYWARDSDTGELLAPSVVDAEVDELALDDEDNILLDTGIDSQVYTEATATEEPTAAVEAQATAPAGTNLSTTTKNTQFCEQLQLLSIGSDLSSSIRLRALRLRAADVQEFRSAVMVPNKDRLIPTELFQHYEARMRAESVVETDGTTNEMRDANEATPTRDGVTDSLTVWRLSGQPAVQRARAQIKQAVSQRFRSAQRNKRLQDVVREDEAPVMGTIGSMFGSLFTRRRPLNPIRDPPKTRKFSELQGRDLFLVCHVVRAFNVPVRRDESAFLLPSSASHTPRLASHFSITSGGSTSSSEISVRPFIEMTFQRCSTKTRVAEGPNPTWNQELRLPVRLSALQESVQPQTTDERLYISLQDEQLVDVQTDSRFSHSTLHQRVERHWLADLNIPLSTLYINQRVEGTFRMNSPPVLLGYERDATHRSTAHYMADIGVTQPATGGSSDVSIQMTDSAAHLATYITVFITLEPAVTAPPQVEEHTQSMESEDVLAQCGTWLQQFHLQYPSRAARCTVSDIQGRATLICRYLQPIQPPTTLFAESANIDEQMMLVARFVALIPNISDVQFFAGMFDLWLTCQQFLDVLAGDEEEHAVLLCNFFLHFGKRAYLVMGHGIPEGETVYVLTEEPGVRWLWNPCTGTRNRSTDSLQSMQRVGCIVGAENIWVNIQSFSHPATMEFDVKMVRDWRPLFSRQFTLNESDSGMSERGRTDGNRIRSIQTRTLNYWTVDADSVRAETVRLEKRLREHFQSWRQNISWTQWNRSCCDALRAFLPHLERAVCLQQLHLSNQPLPNTHIAELQHKILANMHAIYRVTGVPINLPFSTVDGVVNAVYACGVHRGGHPSTVGAGGDCEFALAVYLHPYPCGVVSAWVYVAQLWRRN